MALTANQVELLNLSIGDGIWNSMAYSKTPTGNEPLTSVRASDLAVIQSRIKALPDATVAPILAAYKTNKLAQLNSQLTPIQAKIITITALT